MKLLAVLGSHKPTIGAPSRPELKLSPRCKVHQEEMDYSILLAGFVLGESNDLSRDSQELKRYACRAKHVVQLP